MRGGSEGTRPVGFGFPTPPIPTQYETCRSSRRPRDAGTTTKNATRGSGPNANQRTRGTIETKGKEGRRRKHHCVNPKGRPRCTSSPSCVGRRPGAAGTPTAGSTRFYRTTSIMPGLIALARKKRNRQGHLFLPQNAPRDGDARNLDPRTPIFLYRDKHNFVAFSRVIAA
eukprot:scaffold412_cov311-Pavlova_lutheri.AAC.40